MGVDGCGVTSRRFRGKPGEPGRIRGARSLLLPILHHLTFTPPHPHSLTFTPFHLHTLSHPSLTFTPSHLHLTLALTPSLSLFSLLPFLSFYRLLLFTSLTSFTFLSPVNLSTVSVFFETVLAVSPVCLYAPWFEYLAF